MKVISQFSRLCLLKVVFSSPFSNNKAERDWPEAQLKGSKRGVYVQTQILCVC